MQQMKTLLDLIAFALASDKTCHQYRARPACISMQSDQAVLLTDHLDVPNIDSFKIVSLTGPLKKVSRLSVAYTNH
jgi:hypothetical protein